MTKYIIWLPVLSLLVSCGTPRKNKKTTRQETKTEQSTERTVSTAGTKDSAGATYRTATDSTISEIEFQPDSVKKPAVGNVVVIRPDGTIEATGSIKTVKTTRKQTAAAGDSARVRESHVVKVQDKHTEKAKVTVEEKTKQVKRSVSWGVIAAVSLLVLAIALYIDYRTGGNVLWRIVGLFRRDKKSHRTNGGHRQ